MTRYLIPDAKTVVRALLLRTIQDRRAGRDTSVALGSARDVARWVCDPGRARLLELTESDGSVELDLVVSGGVRT